MKLIIITSHPVPYHVGMYQELANELGESFEVAYLSRVGLVPIKEPTYGTWVSFNNTLLTGYNAVFLTNLGWYAAPAPLKRINLGVIPYILRRRPKVVLMTGHTTVSDWLISMTCWVAGIKLWYRGEGLDRATSTFRSLISRKIGTAIIKKASKVAYSCYGNLEYLQALGATSNRLFQLPCAVQNSSFSVSRPPMGNLINIGVVGKIDSRKRPQFILEALANCSAEVRRQYRVIYVGSGPLESEVKELAKKYDIPCIFHGFADQELMPKIYSTIDILAVYSSYDPSPKVINEAMAAGCAILSHPLIGNARDLVKSGETGFLTSPVDITSLSTALEFATDRSELRRLQKNAKTWIANFSHDVQAKIIVRELLDAT